MNRNVEIKARLLHRPEVVALVAKLADSGPDVSRQEDVFFRTISGRLKLRTVDGQRSVLIHYERSDELEAKLSQYLIVPVPNPKLLTEALGRACGIVGIVRKRRTLYLIGQTRVHLDEVEGLGDFLELEVVLRPEQIVEEGVRIADEIMGKLRVGKDALLSGAYLDLLAKDRR